MATPRCSPRSSSSRWGTPRSPSCAGSRVDVHELIAVRRANREPAVAEHAADLSEKLPATMTIVEASAASRATDRACSRTPGQRALVACQPFAIAVTRPARRLLRRGRAARATGHHLHRRPRRRRGRTRSQGSNVGFSSRHESRGWPTSHSTTGITRRTGEVIDRLRDPVTWLKRLLLFAGRVLRSFFRNRRIARGVGYNALLSLVPFLTLTVVRRRVAEMARHVGVSRPSCTGCSGRQSSIRPGSARGQFVAL